MFGLYHEFLNVISYYCYNEMSDLIILRVYCFHKHNFLYFDTHTEFLFLDLITITIIYIILILFW